MSTALTTLTSKLAAKLDMGDDGSDLIETRVINGTKYILICAEEGVEVNGVNIRIDG